MFLGAVRAKVLVAGLCFFALAGLLAWQRDAMRRQVVRRSFRVARIANGECRMWEAYYAGNAVAMAHEMNALLVEELGLQAGDAHLVTRDLASAAFRFQQMSGGYEAVLPDLESAYARIRRVMGGRWDPKVAARAELDWWVARRTPARSDVAKVGASIAHLYTVLSGKDNEAIRKAGLLRAQAARLRDDGGQWDEVRRLLRESYADLAEGVLE